MRKIGRDQLYRIILAASSAVVLLAALFGVFGLRSHMMVRTILIYLAGGVLLLSAFPKPAWKFLFRFRYLIAGVLFLILVVFGVNGSSAGHWNLITGTPDNAHLFGVSRGIRSDEWALFTPMSLSQYLNPNGSFSYFNPIFSGSDMDMFLMYGQPVWDIATVFRPFFFGYLFLPADQGIAWFWCGRVIALFMVSFEFGRMITGDRRVYALIYALLLTFSPFLQWWFAINGLVEMVIYTELSAVLLKLYLKSESFPVRTAAISGILFSAAGFLLSFYPAWMVPLAYLVLALFAAIVFENRKGAHLKIRDLIAGVTVTAAVAAILAHVILKSWGSIELTMNTAFPGKRVSQGGGSISLLGQYLQNVLYPFQGLVDTGASNESELSQVISFSPLPEVLAVAAMIRNRKKDNLSIAMLGLILLFSVYAFIGLPEFLSKVLLFSFSTGYRIMPVITLLELMLLFRTFALYEKKISVGSAFTVGIGAALAAILMGLRNHMISSVPVRIALYVAFTAVFVLIVLSIGREKLRTGFLMAGLVLAVVSGLAVNPVRRGITDIQKTELVETIRSVNETEEGLFAVTELYPESNLPTLAGCRTLNATNLYPNLETWRKLDPEGKSEEIYNRYAHIRITLKESGDPEFTLDSPDSFTVTLSAEDLKRLGVVYVLARNPVVGEETFLPVASSSGYTIYKLQ